MTSRPPRDYETPVPRYAYLVTVDQFYRDVRHGYMIDYDGYGYPVFNGMMDQNVEIRPSRVHDIPPEATHVAWFNR